MPPSQPRSTVLCQIAEGTSYTAVDVFGPTVEFISGPDDPGADFWVMRGVVPPGVTVPLHSHDDAEDFFILSGTQQVLSESESGLQWYDVSGGGLCAHPSWNPARAPQRVQRAGGRASHHRRAARAILSRDRPAPRYAAADA